MTLYNKTSIKVASQLPEFVRSDENYQTFVAFLQAYYEWMEQQNIGAIPGGANAQGVIYGTQNLLKYKDIDFVDTGDTYNKFIDYYLNDFLPNFPRDALTDKAKLIKIARNLYGTKGTPASYQFLFRALYNSDAEIFLTRDVVLRASDGKWYVSKSLKLSTNDEQFLSISNLRIFGETSKSIATVERGVRSGNRIELYISNIERLFVSGENIRVVDNNNRTLYFKDGEIVSQNTTGATSLRAKIIGSISSVQINSNRRGQLYKPRDIANGYAGDPVVFYGGLETANGIGAEAFVLETTSGSIRAVDTLDGGFGYRADPNTLITFTGGGGSGAIANVSGLDPSAANTINVSFIPTDFISNSAKLIKLDDIYSFFPANVNANLNCTLANAFSFAGFSTFPITSVIVNNGGGGYTSIPSVQADSLFDTTLPNTKAKLGSLGILGPIRILTPGTGYANGEYIVFSNTAGGIGANATVNVNTTGSIISATYRFANTVNGVVTTPLGGFGYRQDRLPDLSVQTSGGSGAVLEVAGILGTGAEFTAIADERGIGAITSILVTNFGEDYVSAPRISLKVRDLIVSNVTSSNLPKNDDFVYQGTSLTSYVFKANVDSISLVESNANPLQSKYRLRVYNYTSNTKIDLQLKITDRVSGPNLYIDLDTTFNTFDSSGNFLFRQGIRTYGNGAAEATARFLNGLIIGQGQYLNDDGFPSSFQLLQDENNNNFTYRLKVQESFSAYKQVLYGLLHPAGTKVIPVNTLKSQANINVQNITFASNSLPLSYYTGTAGSNASVFGSFTTPSNNIIKFDALAGANIADFINVNTILSLSNTHGPNLYSTVVSVDHTSNTVVVRDSIFLRFANVAKGNISNSNTRINITEITNQYDLINNGEYSNTQNRFRDIAFAGDNVRIYHNSSSIYTGTITYVEYSNNVIFVSPAPSFNGNNALITVGRDLISTDVHIYNTLGVPGIPYLITQSGDVLITQDDRVITLGI
jgi:hypothetical protein